MASRFNNLCRVCRDLNLRPETFLQTGWRYPTSLQYQTTDELLTSNNSDTNLGRRYDSTKNLYVEGERLSGVDPNEPCLETNVTDNCNMDQMLPAEPQRNIFDDEGDPEWCVPHKFRKLGFLKDIHRRAVAGCSFCELVVHVSQFADKETSDRQDLDACQCQIRFDFRDVEADLEAEDVENEQLSRSTVSLSHSTTFPAAQASHIAQQNGYYECTLSIGSVINITIYPLFAEDRSKFAWFGGRLIAPEIDYKLVRLWLSSCDTLHPKCSRERHEIDTNLIERLRVIDVVHCCLTEVTVKDVKLVALSYVWGNAPTLKVTKQNLDRLLKPGALTELADQVPNTTKDAMHVVRKLDLQYLWTDSLCILQDDPQEMAPQLRRMDLIYAAAYFTIVAADGSSVAAGLAGSNEHRRRQIPTLFAYGNVMQLLPVPKTLPQVLLDCPWGTRLWTLQEALMSCRLLLFTTHGIHFTCGTLSWSENLKAVSETMPPPWKQVNEKMFHFRSTLTTEDPTSISPISSMWDMEEWISMVMESSERELGFEWDIDNATAGMVTQLERFYRTRNLYGLPECMLTEFLFWSPETSGSLRRRHNASGEPVHPSWSWSGWVGPVGWFTGSDQHSFEMQEHENVQVLIRKLSAIDAEPVPLDCHSLDTNRTLQNLFPYLHISTRTTVLRIDKQTRVSESIQELQSFAWNVVLPQGKTKSGVYAVSTPQTPLLPVGSLVFDFVDACLEEESFDCHVLQLHSEPQRLDVGEHAEQIFYNVLAIKVVSGFDDGTLLAERIGHGRVLVGGTRGLWTSSVVVLR